VVAVILGVDPGLSGAYAILHGPSIVALDHLPVFKTQHGASAKVRAELDLHRLKATIASFAVTHAFIERVAARPGQGVTSMFRFGEACGAIAGLLVGLGVPITYVRPQQWQKHHGIGPSPDAARQRAVQLYPEAATLLARAKDGHRADALLLAAYGQAVVHQFPTSVAVIPLAQAAA
jgi:crossover junction endodeoxyribonuclease RuvC